MKHIIYSFIFGGIIGAGFVFFLINKSTPVNASLNVSSSNPLAKITDQSIIVKSKRKVVTAQASFKTDRAGFYTNEILIPKKDVQFHHNIYGEISFLIVSQTPLLSLGYSYKYFLTKIHVGYSLKHREYDYGVGLGFRGSF